MPFLDINVYFSQGKISTKIYDNRDDFSFPIANVPSLKETFISPLRTVNTFLSLFRMYMFEAEFQIKNERNICITKKL